jgi:predicted amidohydrolase
LIVKPNLLLASISMCSSDSKAKNVVQALDWVHRAADRGADWVLLPEIFAFHGSYDRLHAEAEGEESELIWRLAETARSLEICLFAGSFGMRPKADSAEAGPGRHGHQRVYNTALVFDRQGQEVARYRKTHLFNLYSPKGEALYCESDGFIPGDQLTSFELEGFRVGLAICYDLRFPALFEKLASEGALDVIVLPSAFTLQTGMDHWELLLRARAVEQQCYVFASNQVGDHGRGKASYGHSMIVDPWGYVLANTGGVPGLAVAEMSTNRLREVRDRLPALKNRRPELYE